MPGFLTDRDRVDDLKVELTACKRNICLAEDKGTQLEKQCKQLEKGKTSYFSKLVL